MVRTERRRDVTRRTVTPARPETPPTPTPIPQPPSQPSPRRPQVTETRIVQNSSGRYQPHRPPTSLTPQQNLQNRLATKVPSRPQPAPQQQPQSDKGLVQQWREAFHNAGTSIKTSAKEAVTPQGLARNIKAVGRTTANFVQEVDRKATVYDARRKEEAYQHEQRKMRDWMAIPAEKRNEILEERAEQARLKEQLRQERSKFDQYNADRLLASATGAPFHPKVYKVAGGGMFGEDDKYVDEYGREVPNIPEEYQPKGGRRRVRSESQTLNDIFGGDTLGMGGDGIVGGDGSLRRHRVPRGMTMPQEGQPQMQRPRKKMPDLTDPMLDLIKI